jgi:phytanoyl-CoA hydroxylase
MRGLRSRITRRGDVRRPIPDAPATDPAAEAMPTVRSIEEIDPWDRFLARAAPGGAASITFRGAFEGLWTDRRDAAEVVARRRRSQQLDEAGAALVEHWLEHGYAILPGAVDPQVCDELVDDLRTAFARGDDRLSVIPPGDHFGHKLAPDTDMHGMRVTDVYVYFESARRALLSAAIVQFLRSIFDAAPLLHQSLTFEHGSGQGIHRDTAYVVVDPPLALAASWIALEDVQPGSGELVYFDRSHNLPDYLFSGRYKSWNPERDGFVEHDECANLLHSGSLDRGLPLQVLRVNKGDALIWSADLAHGGGPIEDTSLTRRSLVGHYCPEWAVPRFFDQFPERAVRRRYADSYYASTHYSV